MCRITEIAELHGEIEGLLRTSLPKAIRIGELLAEQKKSLKHGEWLPWAKANLPFSMRTGQNYLRLFKNQHLLKNETAAYLNKGLLEIVNARANLRKASKDYHVPKKLQEKLADEVSTGIADKVVPTVRRAAMKHREQVNRNRKHISPEVTAVEKRVDQIEARARSLNSALLSFASLMQRLDVQEIGGAKTFLAGIAIQELKRTLEKFNGTQAFEPDGTTKRITGKPEGQASGEKKRTRNMLTKMDSSADVTENGAHLNLKNIKAHDASIDNVIGWLSDFYCNNVKGKGGKHKTTTLTFIEAEQALGWAVEILGQLKFHKNEKRTK